MRQPNICPQCDGKVEHDLDIDCHCQNPFCDFDFRDIWKQQIKGKVRGK